MRLVECYILRMLRKATDDQRVECQMTCLTMKTNDVWSDWWLKCVNSGYLPDDGPSGSAGWSWMTWVMGTDNGQWHWLWYESWYWYGIWYWSLISDHGIWYWSWCWIWHWSCQWYWQETQNMTMILIMSDMGHGTDRFMIWSWYWSGPWAWHWYWCDHDTEIVYEPYTSIDFKGDPRIVTLLLILSLTDH